MLTSGYWCFVGTPIPAADTNDLELASKDSELWIKNLDPRDLAATDQIFQPLYKELQLLCGWKKPKNMPLETWKKEENRQISLTRGYNERRIGDIKKRFEFLSKRYRGSWDSLQNDLKTCLAIENINSFPEVIATWILDIDNLELIVSEYTHWLFGKDFIHLAEEVTEKCSKGSL